MKMVCMLRALVLTFILVAFGTTAEAVDMTGTWTGRERCDCFNDVQGKFTERWRGIEIEITQNDTDLNIQAYDELFNGNVIDDPRRSSRGEASLIACNTDPADHASSGEIGRVKVSANDRGRGRMTLESLWIADETEICTCKGNFRRTDPVDPEIGDCSDGKDVDAWHAFMLDSPPTTGGCHVAEYTGPEWTTEWAEVEDCGGDSTKRSLSARALANRATSAREARRVGGPYQIDDWVIEANLKTGPLSKVTGSFENISGATSITDSYQPAAMDPPPGFDLNGPSDPGLGPGYWSLQLNSNHFLHATACQGRPAGCKGWQQYVYSSRAAPVHGIPSTHGQLIIEYWLYDYGATKDSDCPLLPSPQDQYTGTGTRWNRSDNNCWMDTRHYNIASLATAADLGDIHLTGSAGSTSDQAIIRIGHKLHSLTTPTDPLERPDSILGLADHWTEAEFNIFGYGGLTQALFSPRSSVDVKLVVNHPLKGKYKCKQGGTTGESNSLNLSSGCSPVPHRPYPTFIFTQDNY